MKRSEGYVHTRAFIFVPTTVIIEFSTLLKFSSDKVKNSTL